MDATKVVCRVLEELEQRGNMDYRHPNLKYVHLNAPRETDQLIQPGSLIPFFRLVFSLEGFRIEGVNPGVQDYVCRGMVFHMVTCSVNRGLKRLDLLDFSSKTYRKLNIFGVTRQVDSVRFDNLEEFHYDLGFESEVEQQIVLIQNRMPVLKKLYLYRAPLSQPLSNFLAGRMIETLTELHLWGNMSSPLEFLNALPNLQVLKWVTSCYEEKFNGVRVTSVLEESEVLRTYPLQRKDLINQSEEVSTLAHLTTTFELDCGPISAASWTRLGLWMPNLKNLKMIVSRADHLGVIREQWKQLETLELAHGSKLPAGKLLNELTMFAGSFRTFQWRGCACTRKLLGKRVICDLQEAEKKLRSQLPGKCRFPWDANLEGDEATVCKYAVFEETLMSKTVSSMEWYLLARLLETMSLKRDF